MYLVIYEDENFLIVNKESGILVHKTKYDDTGKNLIDVINHERGPHYLAHRIDRFTSGTLVLAKNKLALKEFQRILEESKIEKKYLAIITRLLPAKSVRINFSIGRSKNQKLRFSNKNAKNYKKACTEAKIIEKNLIEISLKTGRTHQIRTHLFEIGCSILNDPIYGDCFFDTEFGQYLHSYSVNFICPITNKPIYAVSELPLKFKEKLSELKIDLWNLKL